jgi:Flp pilus assembly protein TadD
MLLAAAPPEYRRILRRYTGGDSFYREPRRDRMSGWRQSFWTISAMIVISSFSPASRAQAPASAVRPTTMAEAKLDTIEQIEQIEPIETPNRVMALPPTLKHRLHETLGSAESSSQKQRTERLIRFIFDTDGLGMRYREDATHSVAQSYATHEANCVGFTLLFLALAREAGLKASPQGIDRTLAWRQDDRTLYHSNHVNVGIVLGARPYTVDFAIAPVIARDPPTPISDQRLLAHYYNNLAMAALAEGRMTTAQRLLAVSLDLDPNYAPHWSNAGVLYLRNGDAVAAERAYDRALALDPREPSALFNMISLARRTGDANKQAEFERRLSRVQQRDPFHHFLQALNFEQSGDDARAIERYRTAIRLYRGEHRFYAALAHAYRRTGDIDRAIRALKRARALSTGAEREAYAAELDAWETSKVNAARH